MEYYTVTELKDRMKEIISSIEKGEEAIITRKGKPVARLEAFEKKVAEPLWKRKVKPIKIKGGKSSTDILREMRDEETW